MPEAPHSLLLALPATGGCVWLAGAGVSLDAPSGFPVAGDITDALVSEIGGGGEGTDVLRALAWPDPDRRRGPTDFLRFELLMEIVRSVADEDLDVLDFIQQIRQPNALHVFLAERAVDGDLLTTTNFDGLLEIALAARGVAPATVCTESDFASGLRAPTGVPVVKLHGSYERFRDGDVALSKGTIQTTLDGVSRGTAEGVLPEPMRSAVLNAIQGQTLVVVGYSGVDDLDIMPTLRVAEPAAVVWIDHADQDSADVSAHVQAEVEARRVTERSPRDELFLDLFRQGRLRVIRGRTADVLGLSSLPGSAARFDIRSWAGAWARRHLDRVRRPLMIGEALYRTARFDEATPWLERAWTEAQDEVARGRALSPDPIAAWAGRAYARVLVEQGQAGEALRAAEAALGLADLSEHLGEWAECAHEVGFVHYKTGQKEVARKWYERALAQTSEGSPLRAVCLHDIALVHQDRGDFEEARRLYRASRAMSDASGDVRHRSWSEYHLGAIAYDLGDLDEAEQTYAAAQRIAALIGDYNHVSTCLHGRALVAQSRGKVGLAARWFRETVRLDRETGHTEYTGVGWQHLGVCFLECARLATAQRLFARAERAYAAADDDEAVGELWAYRAWACWEQGRFDEARAFAERSVERTTRDGIPEYIVRAAFSCALVGGSGPNLAAMADALREASASGLAVATGDLAVQWVRSGTPLTTEAVEIAQAERDRFQRWGNAARARLIERAIADSGRAAGSSGTRAQG